VDSKSNFDKFLRAVEPHWKVLALLALVLAIAGYFLYRAATSFGSLDNSVKASIIGGTFALLVALSAFLRESSLKRQEAHRSKKVEIYSVFFEMIGRILKETHKNGESSFVGSSEFMDQMMDFKKNLMFYGSPGVLNAFNDFQNNSGTEDGIQIMDRVGSLLLAMRKDVGLSNFGLGPKELYQIMLKDDVK
jgi:hypothetical protein